MADVARRKKRRFSVLFIDWEAQYQCTIEHIQKMREMYRDVTDTFYRYAMTFEEFVPAFSSWFAGNRCGVAILTGVRADESLNRFMGLVSQCKLRYADDKPWTTASPEGFYYTTYPLYDWKARDIWIYNARTRAIYNPLYAIEAGGRGYSAEQRLAARNARTAPLMQSLYDWIQQQMKTLSRHSDTAKAFVYLLKQRGSPERVLQVMAGWKSTTTSQRTPYGE